MKKFFAISLIGMLSVAAIACNKSETTEAAATDSVAIDTVAAPVVDTTVVDSAAAPAVDTTVVK